MRYIDNARYMEGIIVEISDGAVSIDFKGRMGFLKIPMRMLITDYPLQVGQEVGLSMSYVEVLREEPNEKYVSNLSKKNEEV
ncbi:hypothetical protein KQI41_01355 [Tissierella pigra]|uniref:S1 motif domain-containing protein n=1 Tax=Tissierella pigra TaxID=2607614 RepID=A0A6N7Y250_9FIRM|nr:CBO2463/CBO2479 domain-containing protein [Tissierella pigra]MBU5425043.1 hypothetical protein [Tissierella pigra]MSU02548.1 hypothetical protein [Tissierella pigra]